MSKLLDYAGLEYYKGKMVGGLTVSDLTDGKYYKLSGSAAPSGMGTSSSYACGKFRVCPGLKIQVKTYGTSGDARAYAITDIDGTYLSVASEEGFLTYNLTVPANGAWLYVNHKKSGGTFVMRSNLDQTSLEFLFAGLAASLDTQVDGLSALGTKVDNLPVYRAMVGSDLTTGYYYNLSGTTPSGPYALSSWAYAKIAVFAGQKFYLSTVGGNTARAYALTNAEGTILSVADANATLTNQLITVTVDGFLYVHSSSTQANLAKFQLRSANSQLWLENSINALSALIGVSQSPSYKNPPFPYWKDSVRVLILGNSYTQNATAYLSDLLENTTIDTTKLSVYNSSPSGYSIDDWIGRFGDGNTYEIVRRAGSPSMTASGTMEQLVGQAWDVIVINQVSTSAYTWSSYANVKELVGMLRRYCTNPKVCIGFQMAWTHSGAGVDSDYDGIVDCARRLASEIGVDYIIPVGMAMRNARGTSLQNEYDLLSDGTHACKGVGMYVASCCMWESIIAPVFGVSMVGNVTTIDVTEEEITEGHAVAVTAQNRELCQLCAHWATIDMYSQTNIDE